MLFVLIAIVIIALVAVGGFFGWKAEKQRRLDLLSLAQDLGLSFDQPRRDPGRLDNLFSEFNRGHSRNIYNTLHGTLEFHAGEVPITCPVQMGDYTFKETSGSGKNRSTTTYNCSYLTIDLPFFTPRVLIRAENFMDKIGGAMGFDDIDFESAEFSRKFFVKSDDKRFCYDLVDSRMMEFLLASAHRTIELKSSILFIHTGAPTSRRWKPLEFRAHIEFARDFMNHWPRHVVDDVVSRSA